jgi:predicted NBD/HSP70 family sugar kinase
MVTLMRDGADPRSVVAPPEAIGYAKEYVVRGLDFTLLQRAYRSAQGVFSGMILQRLRRLGEASRADLARAAALTNTAVGEIIKQLETSGLVRTLGKKHEGNRGQPATMLALDPHGAYAIGVRLDRTRIETALTDLGGTVLSHLTHDGTLPPPAQTLELVRDDIARMVRLVPASRRRRITGVGVARPYNLGRWLAELDLAEEAFAPWESEAFGPALALACGLPVVEENDGTAAAIAELFHGVGRGLDDFLYAFIGPGIGGGLVLGGQSVRGGAGNAADIGMIPVAASGLPSAVNRAGHDILLGRASLNALSRHLRFRQVAHGPLTELPLPLPAADEWLADCVDALVDPLLTARALLEVPTVVIDSDLPPAWIDRLLALLGPRLSARVAEARSPPALRRGSFGAMAGALGAATLPLFVHFGPGAGSLPDPAREPGPEGAAYALVA